MSADLNECMNDVWTRWQGHVINGAFPLGRYLGCSDHSGVFLTRSAARSRSDIAIKLVPANRALAEYQLPRWKKAGALTHPHLLRLIEWGGCQLEGSPYLYAVMEYADQTLAQLLPHRALTDLEAREMLVPVLDALAFLHGQNLVHGQLKPANVLVVGDQLKLASDTIRRTGEGRPSGLAPSAYDPPEALPGTGSPAGDVWALGLTLCEALTRRPPSTTAERGNALALPSDFSPEFRDLVARCLSLRPQDRPGVPELLSWARGQSVSSAPTSAPTSSLEVVISVEPEVLAQPELPAQPELSARPEVTAQAAPVMQPAAPVRADSSVAAPEPPTEPAPRAPIAALGGVVLLGALGWGGLHLFRAHGSPAAPPSGVQSSAASGPAVSGAMAPAAMKMHPPSAGAFPTSAHGSVAAATAHAAHEVIPDVPLSARRTIRGHIKVWMRATVDQDGSVSAVATDVPGPSRYFQRLALQAARKWTFPPVAAPARRHFQLRFEFSREGTQGRAVPLR